MAKYTISGPIKLKYKHMASVSQNIMANMAASSSIVKQSGVSLKYQREDKENILAKNEAASSARKYLSVTKAEINTNAYLK